MARAVVKPAAAVNIAAPHVNPQVLGPPAIVRANTQDAKDTPQLRKKNNNRQDLRFWLTTRGLQFLLEP